MQERVVVSAVETFFAMIGNTPTLGGWMPGAQRAVCLTYSDGERTVNTDPAVVREHLG